MSLSVQFFSRENRRDSFLVLIPPLNYRVSLIQALFLNRENETIR